MEAVSARRALRPGKPILSWLDTIAFRIFQKSMTFILKLYFGYRVQGGVPAKGPFILAANHTSYLDALLVGGASRRRLRFLMTDLFENSRILGWFFAWNRVIYVKEDGSNRQMFRDALDSLEAGETLGIFPEGGISDDGRLQPLKPGTLALAARKQVPVVPMYVDGAYAAFPRTARLPKPARITICIGEPIPAAELFPAKLSRVEALEHGAALLERRLRALAERCDGPRQR